MKDNMSKNTNKLNSTGSFPTFGKLLTQLRPDLHRYCHRMTSSILDGEDVVQETYTRTYELVSGQNQLSNLRGWPYRIEHNKAIDYLRAGKIRQTEELDEGLSAIGSSRLAKWNNVLPYWSMTRRI